MTSSPNNFVCPNPGCPMKLCRQLESKLGFDGLSSLSQQMPNLSSIINQMYQSQRNLLLPGDVELSFATPVQKHRTNFLFATLLDSLSSLCKVAFFVDDLQWADDASLELLTGLVCRGGSTFNRISNNSLLFIAAYRDDEVRHSLSTLFQMIQSLESLNVTALHLRGVAVESLNETLSEALCLPMRKTRLLSQIIYQKTQGYPLFVVEFLDVLLTEKLITHDKDLGWKWDAGAIELKEMSINVAELLSSKLQRLPQNVLYALQVMSCFGSHVDSKIINIVKNNSDIVGPMIIPALQAAQNEGLVDFAGHTLTFTHNMIQQAAFDLIPSTTCAQLLLRLACCFMNQCNSSEPKSTLFVAVDLINRIGAEVVSNNAEQCFSFASLNLDAGKKAMEITDFASALKYFNSGISFLRGRNHWDDRYELCLGLFENAASANYCEGKHKIAVTQANIVLENARNFEDKFKSYCVFINVIGIESMNEAIEKLHSLLSYLGGSMDPKTITSPMFDIEARKVKEMLKGDNKLKILYACRMTDRKQLMKMKAMAILTIYYSRQRSFMGGYLACQMIRLSCEHGHCEDTAYALSLFAFTVSNVQNDAVEACALVRSSLSLSKIYNTDDLITRTYPIIFGLVLILEEPLHSILDPMLKACRLSFVRNVESAIWNTFIYVARSFQCGKDLFLLMNEVNAFAQQHKLHDQMDFIEIHLAPFHKFLCSLTGTPLRSDFLSNLASTCSYETTIQRAKLKGDTLYKHGILATYLAESFYHRNFYEASQVIHNYSHCIPSAGQQNFGIAEFDSIFYIGLVSFHMARETHEQYWLDKGNAALQSFEGWSKQCVWNFENRYFLLKAEYHNTMKQTNAAVEAYDASIESAQRHRFIHLEAVACELAGHYFDSIPSAKKRTKEMVQKSSALYLKWGAKEKADEVAKLIG